MLAFCTLLQGTLCVAQNSGVHVSQLSHKAWRLREGEIPGGPNAIAQTKDGYIWVGTDNGLYRFDGKAYELIQATAPDHVIRVQSLLADRDGSLWVGAGASLYHFQDGTLRKMPGVHKVLQMFQEASGDVWIATQNLSKLAACRIRREIFDCPIDLGMNAGGFSIANDGRGGYWVSNSEHLRHRTFLGTPGFGDAEIPWSGTTDVLGSDGKGRVWAGVHDGKFARLFEQDGQGWRPLSVLPGLRNSSNIQSIFSDREGALWVGTSDAGIYRITSQGIDRFDQTDGLSNNQISDITQDAEGSIWLATSGGIDQFHRALVDSWSTREGLSGDSVSAVAVDTSGRIWMSNTGGLDVYDNGAIRSYRPGTGLPGIAVTSIAADHAGRLWVGIDEGLWILDKGSFHEVLRQDGKKTLFVVLMNEDRAGHMWVKANAGELFRSSGDSLQAVNWKGDGLITALCADPVDGIWIGARNMPAFHVSSEASVIDTPNTSSFGKNSFASLFYTNGKLISQTTRDMAITGQEQVAVLNQNNGLNYEAFYASALSTTGDVYLMTEKSYLQIKAQDFQRWVQNPSVHVPSRVIDGADGAITGNSTFGPSSAVAPNGDIWFATDRFPQRIVPGLLNVKHAAPSIQVQGVSADGRALTGSHRFTVRAGSQALTIRYAALSYLQPDKIQYRYLLDGYDTDWQQNGPQRQATYSHLPPGVYHFRVVASDLDGQWNSDQVIVDISVLPHFYQMLWFRLLLLMAMAFALWLMYLARLRYLIERTKAALYVRMSERERIARDLHDTFFQGIQGLLLRFQTGTSALPIAEPVKPMFEGLLKQSDQVMHEGRELVLDLRTPLFEEANLPEAFARLCAEMQSVLPTKYNVIVQGRSKPLNSAVSGEVFRIGKEAVTNAFLHSGATIIEVELSFDARDFKLRVRDDGRGIETAIQQAGRPGHFGLTGMRERAAKIGGQLILWSQAGAGTEVEVSIPSSVAFPTTGRAFSWLVRLRDKEI